ncbi:MAG: iron-sulfur cluster repair di-iron protein, partial [Bacteroidetes bacterium]|nr:iron-sulfur cluster repair di-iron protein [Bacteroidota bacterium]
TWEYLEQGPEWWKVMISKTGKDEQHAETIGEMAAKDIRKAEVFKKMGIDFCCGGGKTLKEACAEAGVSEEGLKQALQSAENNALHPSQDYNKWDLGFLSDYIVNTHHRYVKDNAELIYGLAVKVSQHHGQNHPELKALSQKLQYFLQDLLDHMSKEESILFPAIKEAVSNKERAAFIRQPIMLMQREHDISGEDMDYFRKITGNYTLPADACNSYNYLFEKLKEFEDDLHQHIHLENNILFPKALKLAEK